MEEILGYELICKMSEGSDQKEYNIIIKEDPRYDSGYVAIVSGEDEEGEKFVDEKDADGIIKGLTFGSIDIVSKIRI